MSVVLPILRMRSVILSIITMAEYCQIGFITGLIPTTVMSLNTKGDLHLILFQVLIGFVPCFYQLCGVVNFIVIQVKNESWNMACW